MTVHFSFISEMFVNCKQYVFRMAFSVVKILILTLTANILTSEDPAKIGFTNVQLNLTADLNSNEDNVMWCQLTDIAINVFVIQNKVRFELPQNSLAPVVIVIADTLMWKSSTKFINSLGNFHQGAQFVYLQLGEDNLDYDNVTTILFTLVMSEVKIDTVAVWAENQTLLQLLHAVSTCTNLRWTSVIHLTEWIIMSTSSEVKHHLQSSRLNIDFITVIFMSATELISVLQKSRGGDFNQVFSYRASRSCTMDTTYSEANILDINRPKSLRLHPLVFLKTQKSMMASLKIPVAISAKNYTRISSYTYTPNNETIYGGFTVTLLRLMEQVLGFTCNFVMVNDGGGYGEALSNGTVTGMTGLLARREAAAAALVSRLQNRARVIDFLPTILMEETANIVYRLPKAGETLDLTYVQIIQPGFLLSLVGPVIMIALIGAVVHVATRECTSPRPRRFSTRDLRSLRSFPQHVFFLADNYAGQTGRILIGTWGTFCLILWAAYSAYLVTTFATKPNELAINSFQQLIAHSEFKVGMLGSGNALAIILKTSNDMVLQKVWNRMLEGNKTDPLTTFSSDLNDHVRRIVQGRYAFIDNFSIASGLFYDFLPPNYTDVRAYPQTSLQGTEASYIAIPKYVFYKDILYTLQLELEMAGIILKLQKIYFSNTNQPTSRTKHEGNVVDFGRIEFLVYSVLAAILVSFICLLSELVIYRWQRKDNWKK